MECNGQHQETLSLGGSHWNLTFARCLLHYIPHEVLSCHAHLWIFGDQKNFSNIIDIIQHTNGRSQDSYSDLLGFTLTKSVIPPQAEFLWIKHNFEILS